MVAVNLRKEVFRVNNNFSLAKKKKIQHFDQSFAPYVCNESLFTCVYDIFDAVREDVDAVGVRWRRMARCGDP